MARIPDEEIERLKKEIPIERMVTGFGVELKRQGTDLFGRCPFPDDRTPSQQRRRLYFVGDEDARCEQVGKHCCVTRRSDLGGGRELPGLVRAA